MTEYRMKIRAILIALVVLASATQPAASDENKVKVNLRLFDVLAEFPGPTWITTGKISEETEIYRQQSGPQFIFEFVPKGETFERWTQLYAVFAIHSDRLSDQQFINASIGVFATACGRSNLTLKPAAQLFKGAIVVIYCHNSPQGPAKLGYGDGVGEITVMRLQRVENTHIKLYHHWRGTAFDMDDTAGWPASPAQIDAMVERLKQASFIAPRQRLAPAPQPAPQFDR